VLALPSAGQAAFWGKAVYVAILFVGWIYALRRGDLDWSR